LLRSDKESSEALYFTLSFPNDARASTRGTYLNDLCAKSKRLEMPKKVCPVFLLANFFACISSRIF
jgi:hypothetical protein